MLTLRGGYAPCRKHPDITMRTTRLTLPLAFLALFSCCSTEDSKKDSTRSGVPSAAQPAVEQGVSPEARPLVEPAPGLGAKVLETMDAGGYTYANLELDGKQAWYAVQQCAVKVGDRVTVAPGAMAMQNFTSESLKRTFDLIYFAQSLRKVGDPDAVAASGDPATDAALVHAAHEQTKGNAPVVAVEPDTIEKVEGGMTVAEICGQGAALAGKDVVLRGKVVKYTPGILGKNWLHVRDGTGTEGSNDITVTTAGAVRVGDIVVLNGKVAVNRDFGYGYVYALIIEDAKVVVE